MKFQVSLLQYSDYNEYNIHKLKYIEATLLKHQKDQQKHNNKTHSFTIHAGFPSLFINFQYPESSEQSNNFPRRSGSV